ncbi:MAG TPA: Asp-tRNA(Asn)/Glu-tRNA(Gln) amidotransferase subunit GatC [Candidatus Paceibacterota bacterium]
MAISRADIENLAQLSRLKLSGDEIANLEKDFSSILQYVGQVSAVPTGGAHSEDRLHNVMREDIAVPDAPGNMHESLLEAFPRRDGDSNVVRQIIQKD